MKYLTVFLSVMVLFTAVPSVAQEAPVTPEGIKAMCVDELSKQDQMGIDVQKYCSCLGTRLSRHTGKLEHTDGERVRKQVINDLGPCFDEHMKPPVMALCSGFNDKMAAEKQKVKMDCGCYYSKVVDNFGSAWAKNLSNEPVPAEEQAMLAQEAVANCARELP